jgi:hypothetical protein
MWLAFANEYFWKDKSKITQCDAYFGADNQVFMTYLQDIPTISLAMPISLMTDTPRTNSLAFVAHMA